MRVCLVTPFAWSLPHEVNDHVAGVAAELREARALGHRARSVEQARPTSSTGAARSHARPTPSVIALGPSVPISRRSSMGVPVGARASLTIALARGGYDVVHGFEPGLPSLSYLALRHARTIAVASFFSAERLGYPPGKAQRERLLGRIDALVASSPDVAAAAAERFPGDYRVLSPGVDTEALPARPKAAADRARVARPRAAARPRRDPDARRAARLGARRCCARARSPARPVRAAPARRPRPLAARRATPRRARALLRRGRDLRPGARGQRAARARGRRRRRGRRPRRPASTTQPELAAPRSPGSPRTPTLRDRGAGRRAHRAEQPELRRRRRRARRPLPRPRPPPAHRPPRRRPARRPPVDPLRPAHAHRSGRTTARSRSPTCSTTPRRSGSARSRSPTTTASAARSEAVELAREPQADRDPRRGGEDRRPGRGDRPVPRGGDPARPLLRRHDRGDHARRAGSSTSPTPSTGCTRSPTRARCTAISPTSTSSRSTTRASCASRFNDEALRFARKYDLTMGAGSDAHVLPGVGTGAVRMRAFNGPEEFLVSLQRGRDPAAAEVARRTSRA